MIWERDDQKKKKEKLTDTFYYSNVIQISSLIDIFLKKLLIKDLFSPLKILTLIQD